MQKDWMWKYEVSVCASNVLQVFTYSAYSLNFNLVVLCGNTALVAIFGDCSGLVSLTFT
jgi:hypothetical protein